MKLGLLGLVVMLLTTTVVQAAEFLNIRGHWQQGGLLFGEVPPGSLVKVEERTVRVSPDGRFVFGLGRDAAEQVSVVVTTPRGETITRTYPVAKREYRIQRVEGVEQKHVTPPAEVLERINREAALVRDARAVDDPRTDFLQSFRWPLIGPITGVYGSQRVYNGVPKSPHYGLDIAGPVGAKVMAPAPGVITLAESDLYYSGGTVILDHGHGLSSTFIHLSKVLVKDGDRVEQGDVLGEVGATGRATGPHLDWRINWFDERVDPALLMEGTSMEAVPKLNTPASNPHKK